MHRSRLDCRVSPTAARVECWLSAGCVVSIWAVDLILTISPTQLPSFVQIGVDRNVIGFAIAVALLIALLMAIAPALQFAPANLHDRLSSNSTRTTGARSTKHFRNALIIGEVALSFVLLLSAGLLVESFRHLLRIDTGFEPSHLLTLRLGFDSQMQNRALAAKEAVERLPGVKSVALSSVIPFSGGPAFFYSAEGQEAEATATRPRAYASFIGPGFFRTMGIPLRYGRDFDNTDREQSVIVSEKVVQRFWPGQDPIGKRIKIGGANSDNAWMNIVGVVGDTRTRGIPDNPTADPDIYMTLDRFGGNPGLLIRTELDPAALAPTVLNEVKPGGQIGHCRRCLDG
jgi:MacB-like periplasmic core domain